MNISKMKLFVFIVFLLCMAGCASPQAPVIQPKTIAGLSIPDTIDFGVVRVGVAKDSNVVFKNTGSDTIYITSQRFSDSSFKLLKASQSQLAIAPGTSQTVSIQFLPSDISAALCYDTIRTANKINILMLRGGAIPFISLAVLSIPDTIDFGVVRAGLTKDTSVIFKNTGTDTLKITSQIFSNLSFKLSNAAQSQLNFAPGTSQSVTFQYTPSDTSAILSYDTIRTAYGTNILVLRGRAIPFSSEFLIAPKEIDISLTGVIGAPYGLPSTYSFYYDEPYYFPYSYDSLYYFRGGTSGGDYDTRGDETDWWYNSTGIQVIIDTNLIIKSLSVKYEYFYGVRLGEQITKSEVLNLHDIALIKTGDSYAAVVLGASIMSLIDTVYIQADFPPNNGPHCNDNLPLMNSLIGFTDSAKLSFTIK